MTPVQKLKQSLTAGLTYEQEVLFEGLFELAEQEESKLLDDIDTDLASIEDIAKGEVGDRITTLRHKLQTLNKN